MYALLFALLLTLPLAAASIESWDTHIRVVDDGPAIIVQTIVADTRETGVVNVPIPEDANSVEVIDETTNSVSRSVSNGILSIKPAYTKADYSVRVHYLTRAFVRDTSNTQSIFLYSPRTGETVQIQIDGDKTVGVSRGEVDCFNNKCSTKSSAGLVELDISDRTMFSELRSKAWFWIFVIEIALLCAVLTLTARLRKRINDDLERRELLCKSFEHWLAQEKDRGDSNCWTTVGGIYRGCLVWMLLDGTFDSKNQWYIDKSALQRHLTRYLNGTDGLSNEEMDMFRGQNAPGWTNRLTNKRNNLKTVLNALDVTKDTKKFGPYPIKKLLRGIKSKKGIVENYSFNPSEMDQFKINEKGMLECYVRRYICDVPVKKINTIFPSQKILAESAEVDQ